MVGKKAQAVEIYQETAWHKGSPLKESLPSEKKSIWVVWKIEKILVEQLYNNWFPLLFYVGWHNCNKVLIFSNLTIFVWIFSYLLNSTCFSQIFIWKYQCSYYADRLWNSFQDQELTEVLKKPNRDSSISWELPVFYIHISSIWHFDLYLINNKRKSILFINLLQNGKHSKWHKMLSQNKVSQLSRH